MVKRKADERTHHHEVDSTEAAQSRRRKDKDIVVDSRSDLLGLPPELRNQIYRYALVSSENIIIDDMDHEEPPLLRTCRQLRKGANGIYRLQNRFTVMIRELQFEMPIGHWAQWKIPLERIQIGLSGAAKWSNLERWLELFHRRSTYIALSKGQAVSKYQVIARTFGIAHALR